MSRSGYSDNIDDNWALIRYRGRVASATRGKRGQSLIRDMIAAFERMRSKSLCSHNLMSAYGEVCALGAVAQHRGIDVRGMDPRCPEAVAAMFDIAEPLACEIVFENEDEWGWSNETGRQRFARMQRWAERNLSPTPAQGDE